jgi:hypothetical protein
MFICERCAPVRAATMSGVAIGISIAEKEGWKMILRKDIAKQVSQLMLEYAARLDASVALVQSECSPDELAVYRLAVGTVMGDMLLEIMNPLYKMHPDLKPPQLN